MSFRRRLLLVMLAVMCVAQLVTAAATLQTIRQDVLQKGEQELDVSLGVMRQLLDERGQQLRNNVAILTADFGFKSAISSQDVGTLASVLANHGARAGADIVLLADPNGDILASSDHAPGTSIGFSRLWQQAQRDGQAIGVILEANMPYQFVLLPVGAPNLVGWVGMGFLLDGQLAGEIGRLIRLQVSFLVDGGASAGSAATKYVAGALKNQPDTAIAGLAASLAEGNYLKHSGLDESLDALTRAARLKEDDSAGTGAGRVYAIIQNPRTDLLAIFQALSWQLLAIFALTLLLTVMAAAISARGISLPLMRLAEAAQRIGRGERLEGMRVASQGELGMLANTLMTMQEDIAERERQQLYQACHDQLTDLANRHSAQQDIDAAAARELPFTLLRLSISGFRDINDTFGYATGDQVLVRLAQRLRELPAPLRQAYRLGGDEFLLTIDGPQTQDDWLKAVRKRLAQPIELDHGALRLKLVYGEVNFPRHGSNGYLLLRRAEVAMDMAQQANLGYLRYMEGQDEQHLRQLTLARDLQEAAARQQLSLVYQPKIAAAGGELVSFEALMRWRHPELGFIAPDEFIALAERSGFIGRLTQWMLHTVCRQLADWQRQGQCVNVAINLSAQDVVDPGLPGMVRQALDEHGLDAGRLALEVTESAIIQDPTLARTMLGELCDSGLHIAIDDYGTGYSSLSQLKSLPVRELKIDKSFILKLDQQSDDRIIVRSTIELGHNLGLEVVAEGVETLASRELLTALGCDYLQGYLISRPLPAEQVLDWIDTYRRCKADT
ncbi:putative bifunctional diguanylate cyclase/phosphodiesterase [Halomonas sp. IOP_31]|uniref:putative bifunctional diguanylate cyclase/phosphodiesterase n=1 Tax=Halomonas sp. IOP_31 TaxID=2876584 RepID=UPI001E4AB978|nr:EAL domain-containing protein [Halomonas sp. IOP_31]MCD6009173.1 EAL domain-containing protein [Halomonas sp. IOP_31]